MRPVLAIEPESGDLLEIQSLTLFERIYGTVVVGAAGAFFAFLALTQPGRGHEVGYALSGVCLWWALYFASLPRVKVTLGPDGIEFTDMSWAIFLRYPRYRVAWCDILGVGSRSVASRYGSYIRTRVKVRISEVPLETRRFSVTSRNPGYYAFLQQLNDHIDPSAVAVGGMGIEPAKIRAAARQILHGRLQLLFGLLVVAVMLVLVAYFTRR